MRPPVKESQNQSTLNLTKTLDPATHLQEMKGQKNMFHDAMRRQRAKLRLWKQHRMKDLVSSATTKMQRQRRGVEGCRLKEV